MMQDKMQGESTRTASYFFVWGGGGRRDSIMLAQPIFL